MPVGRPCGTRTGTPAQDGIRTAYPDQVAFTEGLEPQQVVQRLVSDRGDDAAAVTQTSVPPAAVQQCPGGAGRWPNRSTNPLSPVVEYLAPSFRSRSMANAKARQAFAMATDRGAYVAAMGGTRTAVPTTAVVSQTLHAYLRFDPFGVGLSGDPQRARSVLQQSGLTLPVPVRVAYRQGVLRDRAMAALKARWTQRVRGHVAAAGHPLRDDGEPARVRHQGRRVLGAVGGRLRLGHDGDPAAVRQPGQPVRGRLWARTSGTSRTRP